MYTIEQAYACSNDIRPSRRDRIVRDGWDLLRDGEWCQRFRTKREAEAAKAALEQEQA